MIEQLKFYMTEASLELLEARREYIERVIVKSYVMAWKYRKTGLPSLQVTQRI